MSSELEQRLEAMLADAPEPEPGAGEEALHRALRSLHPVSAPRRGFRAGALAFATAVVLLVIAGASLGAAGALHVSLGTQPRLPVVSGLLLPKGADGISTIVYGRLSARTTSGFNLAGLPVTAATLSPHGLYVAAGIGRSLVALAPTGRRAWSQPTGVAHCETIDRACGTVASVAWAPDGLRVAYVVRTNTRHLVLHVIWGNGTHDTVVDRNAQGATPSWRADSLAVAYVGAGGRPIIYDLGHESHHVIGWPQAHQTVQLAFAPRGGQLALSTENAALLVGNHQHEVLWRGQTRGVAWLGGRLVVSARVSSRIVGRIYSVRPRGSTLSQTVRLPSPIIATHGEMVAVISRDQVLAGPLGSLRPVLQFRVKGCNPEGCEIPIGDRDVDLG